MEKGQWRYRSILFLLMICAFILTIHVSYLYLADRTRFPINTVKITANYRHISRHQLEDVLSEVLAKNSFFTFPVRQLRGKLQSLPWVKLISIERIWPDTLKIHLVENNPVAIWNDDMLMEDGQLVHFADGNR